MHWDRQAVALGEWQANLIEHMSLNIEGVRPAVLSRELALRIDELRSFRHVFRNIYQSELDPKRVQFVQQQIDSTVAAFKSAHEVFVRKVRTIAAQLKE